MEYKRKRIAYPLMSDRCNMAGTCIFYADISPVVCVFEFIFWICPGNTGTWLAFDFNT